MDIYLDGRKDVFWALSKYLLICNFTVCLIFLQNAIKLFTPFMIMTIGIVVRVIASVVTMIAIDKWIADLAAETWKVSGDEVGLGKGFEVSCIWRGEIFVFTS